MNDIDLQEQKIRPIGYDWYNPLYDSPILFKGVLDENGHKIKNLLLDTSDRKTGALFFNNSGMIKNVGLVNIKSNGTGDAAGLVFNNTGVIKNCYAKGNIIDKIDGGLVKENRGKIINSYSDDNTRVIGNKEVGGLVGYNCSDGIITKMTYSQAAVQGKDMIGGLIGNNSGIIKKVYAKTNQINGNNQVGGLAVGNRGGRIKDCCSKVNISGKDQIGELVGFNYEGYKGDRMNFSRIPGVIKN
ncbi:MAG: hypothetical protein ACQEQF_05885 [Bacillota bacterium]